MNKVELTLLQYYNIKFPVTVLSDYAITIPCVYLTFRHRASSILGQAFHYLIFA